MVERRVRSMLEVKSMVSDRVFQGGIEVTHRMKKGQSKYACNPRPSVAEQFDLLAV
ncbi:hypothetical protein J4G37_28165 [Microvirga sp. 3-52]|nr:hypothetical protein [Microvirga sp. 3-52]